MALVCGYLCGLILLLFLGDEIFTFLDWLVFKVTGKKE